MYKVLVTIILGLTIQISYGQVESNKDFIIAKGLLRTESFQKAVDAFSTILHQASDNNLRKFCFIYRAFSYNGLNDFKNAVSDLDSAIEIDPNDLASYIDRGKSKVYANNIEGAKNDFLFILIKDSSSEQAQAAFYYLAKLAYAQRQYEQSIIYYGKLLRLAPRDSEAYFNRAAAKGMLHDVAGSINDYTKAIETNPNYMEAYANRGVAKINILTTNGNIQPSKTQTSDACADLKKAKQLGDKTVDDMIFIYCEKK